jgi:protein TonB
MHVRIAKGGSIQQLYVLQGYCTLAQAAVDAVKQWRYSPTKLNGEPVEVQTVIDVIFQLQ